MKKLLIKTAYKILVKYSYKYLPYFYCGDVYKVVNAHLSYDLESKKSFLTITAEREWHQV